MKKLIFLIASAIFPTLVFGAEKYDNIPEAFIGHLQEKDFQKAVESIYPDQDKSYLSTPDGALIISKLKHDLEGYGEYKYHELISEEKIGTRFVIVTYIVGMQFKPSYMSFKLYRPEEHWAVLNFKYNDNLHTLKKQNVKDTK